MRKGVSGFYSYVVAENTGKETVTVSELRNVYRFNPHLLDHISNGEREGRPYLYADLEKMPKVQDETGDCQTAKSIQNMILPVISAAAHSGAYTEKTGGAWLIPGSGEYFSGDALKQDLMVHQDAIILNYMTGAHMGTPDMQAQPGWKNCMGHGCCISTSSEQMLADARSASRYRAGELALSMGWRCALCRQTYPSQRSYCDRSTGYRRALLIAG